MAVCHGAEADIDLLDFAEGVAAVAQSGIVRSRDEPDEFLLPREIEFQHRLECLAVFHHHLGAIAYAPDLDEGKNRFENLCGAQRGLFLPVFAAVVGPRVIRDWKFHARRNLRGCNTLLQIRDAGTLALAEDQRGDAENEAGK